MDRNLEKKIRAIIQLFGWFDQNKGLFSEEKKKERDGGMELPSIVKRDKLIVGNNWIVNAGK